MPDPEFTPTTANVRVAFGAAAGFPVMSIPERGRAFARWLTAHDRTVAAKAWAEGFGAGFQNMADIADHFRNGGSIESIRPPAENPYAEQIGEDQ